MTATHDNLIIIAGGPGAGKTTLINLLRDAGYATAPEAGRALIQERRLIGGPAEDPALSGELMLSWEIRSYRWAQRQSGPVFFDHAVPSVVGWYALNDLPVPAHVEAAVAVYPYRREVFVAPPWPTIYRTDAERHQTLDDARRIYDAVVAGYLKHGYEPVEIPRGTPAERVRFIMRHAGLIPAQPAFTTPFGPAAGGAQL